MKASPNADTRNLTLDDLRSRGADRRTEPRIPRRRPIVILPCSAEPKWDFREVTLLDCTPHGVAIISSEPMKRGEEFLARVKVKRMTMVIYRVCHCAALPDGRYKIGARLVEFVGTPDEILQALLAAEEAAGTADRNAGKD